jgi:alanyl-tRNA synthetase
VTLPRTDTIVTYPAGDLTSESRVLHVEPLGEGRAAVLLDRTACHPVDAGWPDQGPDRATLGGAQVLDCVVAATDGERLFLGADTPVRKGTEGWAFVVAHVVAAGVAPAEGDTVVIEVDAAHRAALSAGHSACHLAALALDAALTGAWSKDNRGFDAAANETSLITEYGSVDTYRVGRSVRKAGFDPTALDDPDAVAARVNEILASFSGAIRIERDGELLTDRRYWVAELPSGEARLACGGTHVGSVGELGAVTVELAAGQLEGALGLTMTTRAG